MLCRVADYPLATSSSLKPSISIFHAYNSHISIAHVMFRRYLSTRQLSPTPLVLTYIARRQLVVPNRNGQFVRARLPLREL